MEKEKNNKNIYPRTVNLKEKEIIYLSLIYLLEPFYIDIRGDKIRRKLRSLLIITKKKEEALLTKLENLDLIEKTGFLISIRNKKTVRNFLDNLIEKNKINLNKINELFIN